MLAVKGPACGGHRRRTHAYEAAAAAAALAEREFADTRLYAPSDGVVEDRILEPGDMASPQHARLYDRADRSSVGAGLRVRNGSRQGSARACRRPSPRTASRGGGYRGWVGYISPTAEFTPKTVETAELRTRLVYQVRIYACDSHGELHLGMPATVTIDLAAVGRTGAAATRTRLRREP